MRCFVRVLVSLTLFVLVRGSAQVLLWDYTYSTTMSLTKTFALGFDQSGNLYLAGEAGRYPGAYDDFTVISLTAAGRERWVYHRRKMGT